MRIRNECVFVCLHFQLHMLGDGSRGAVIEMTLAKVLYMSSKGENHSSQCVNVSKPPE